MRGLLALVLLSMMIGPAVAQADGDRSLQPSFLETGPGVRVVSSGVGLAGRIAGGTVAPRTTGTITIAGIPAGAEIRRALLYWVVLGAEPATSASMNGVAVTGTLIGTSETTCWDPGAAFDLETAPNLVYRADVTARVTGDGDYVLTGLPSGEFSRDSQGASLVIIYEDPAMTEIGNVAISDGAASSSAFAATSLTVDFSHIPVVTALGAELHIGVGDAELTQADGSLDDTLGRALDPALGGLVRHFDGRDGNYWDDNTYDISGIADAVGPDFVFRHTFAQDCIVFAYGAVAFRTAEPIAIDAGVGDAGARADGGGRDGGALADAAGIDAARLDAGSIDAASGVVATSGGCGCRAAMPGPSENALLGAALLALGLVACRRRAGRACVERIQPPSHARARDGRSSP